MNIFAVLFITLTASFAVHAELQIKPVSELPERMKKNEARARLTKSDAAPIQTLEQVMAQFSYAKAHSEQVAQKPDLESFTRKGMLDLGCKLMDEISSGVEKENGKLNGVASIYSCASAHAVVYEYEYISRLKQKVTYFDDDFSGKTGADVYFIKEHRTVQEGVERVAYTWLNPQYEIRVGVYVKGGDPVEVLVPESFEEVLSQAVRRLVGAARS